jgi:hypothetical protein
LWSVDPNKRFAPLRPKAATSSSKVKTPSELVSTERKLAVCAEVGFGKNATLVKTIPKIMTCALRETHLSKVKN